MALTVTNLIQGPARLWTGAFGVAEPLDTAVGTDPGAGWTDAGGTQDGVSWEVNQEYSELEVDQIVDVPESRLTKRVETIKTNMAEATLANIKIAFNGGTITVAASNQAYDPTMDTSATQPTYLAVILDGYAPRLAAGTTMRRRVIMRKTLSVESVASSYKKDGQTLIPVTFKAHYVSTSIVPYRIIDQLT